MSNFGFLQAEFPAPFESTAKAESLVYPDPRVSCFYARRVLELAVAWLYRHDNALKLPYQDHLSALIHEPTFRSAVGPTLHAKVRVIKDLGNLAVHSTKAVRQIDALMAVRELFHFGYWLARTYGRSARPAPGITFDPNLLPKASPVPPQTLAQLQRLEEELAQKDVRLTELLTGKAARADAADPGGADRGILAGRDHAHARKRAQAAAFAGEAH